MNMYRDAPQHHPAQPRVRTNAGAAAARIALARYHGIIGIEGNG